MGDIYEIPINTLVRINGIYVAEDKLCEVGFYDAAHIKTPIDGSELYCAYSFAGHGDRSDPGNGLKPLNLGSTIEDIVVEALEFEMFYLSIRSITKDVLTVENLGR